MPETIALLNNNIFYAMGLQNLIPTGYELQNISAQDLERKDIKTTLPQAKSVLITSEFVSPKETINLVKSLLEKQKQIIYLAQSKDKLVSRLCSMGCQGILDQEQVKDQLCAAINAVISGGTYYSQGLLNDSYMVFLEPLAELFEELDTTSQKLTPKEKEVFNLYVSGLSLTKIMEELAISKSTINTHMESIRTKSGVVSNREIITRYQITRLKSNL
jgi:DNA-binding NarL/FixJ family response regulator